MYTPYLMCAYAASLLLMLFGFREVRRSTPDLRGVPYLTWFVLSDLSAVLLMAARPWLPALLSTVLANFLLFAGVLLIYLAATDILDVQPRLFPWRVGLFIGVVPLFLWATYVDRSLLLRLLIHCGFVGTICATTAVLFLRKRDQTMHHAERACAGLMIAMTVLQVLWCIAFVAAHHNPNFTYPDMMDVAFSYMSMILAIATVISLLWLSFSLHRLDLHKMAQTDALTGLLNRRALEEILRRELIRCNRGGDVMGLMLIDLDHFKLINDTLGHFAGDAVLRRVSMVLHDGTRPSDVLARYGGEEFVVLLRNAGVDESQTAAERIRREIAALTGLPGSLQLTASIGVTVNRPGETPGQILLRADEALYRSKRGGRNLVSVDHDLSLVSAATDFEGAGSSFKRQS